jgi:hypothetical protein
VTFGAGDLITDSKLKNQEFDGCFTVVDTFGVRPIADEQWIRLPGARFGD